MNREQRRALDKKAGKGTAEIQEKVALFGKLGDHCLTCEKPFDKRNKEMVMSWHVVVKQEQEQVRLYCDTCWSKAQEVIKDFTKRIEERNETND